MKRLFVVLAVLAVAHMLGLVGVIGWLVGTKRLDMARMEKVRQMFVETIPQEQARLDAEQQAAQAALADQPEPLPENDPVPAEVLVSQQGQLDEAAHLRKNRMERETKDLVATISLERSKLDRQRQQFVEEKTSFELMRKQIAAVEGEAQFQHAVDVLTGVKPASAKAMLKAIIEGKAGSLGADGESGVTGMDRAVAYLNKIDGMKLSNIMEQFTKDSPELAAQLLERLRTYGMMASASGEHVP